MSRSSLKRNFLNYTGNEDADSSRIFQWDENELEETQPEGVVEDSESSENEELELEAELSSMPFGMLRKAERAMDQKQKGLVERDSESLNPSRTQSPQEESGSEDEKDRKSKHVKRHNKHAPMEVTSKRPVTRKRLVVDVSTFEPRDPRFVSVVGEYSSEKFQRHYEFLVGAHMAELFTLKENLKTARKLLATSPRDFRDARSREVEHLELAVKRAESQVNKDKTKKIEQEALKKVKREEREKRLQGKSAWYMKKGEKKALVTKAKYEVLATEGGARAVNRAIARKKKKLGQKEKKSRPGP